MKEFEIAFPAKKKPSENELRAASAKAMGIPMTKLRGVSILRRSLDARSREVLYRYRVQGFTMDDPLPEGFKADSYRNVSSAEPVVVVGAGPAGLFAALKLLQNGLKPIILERGKDVHNRKYDIAAISRDGALNSDSNYCFGEGGAGAFSDGKLYTRSNKRGDVSFVLNSLVSFGADKNILIDAHPHIGSDKLPLILEKVRECIIAHGGEYHFNCRVTDISKESGKWKLQTAGGSFSSRNVILAVGHSAKDIYELFENKGWALEAKGFALGVRVEHPQMLINQIQYHGRYESWLPAAEYSLVTQVEGRGVYSFCNCPGGILVPTPTEPGGLVLNGMSGSRRNSEWANAGMVVSVEPEDIIGGQYGSGPLAMLRFQEDIEKKAFDATSSFAAPAQRMTDFVRSRAAKPMVSATLPKTSYFPGASSFPLQDILPSLVSDRLKKAFPLFDQKMKGYYTSEALLLGVESRTSSAVRIPRDPETLQHISLQGIYPCGEGAGYAGGIVSCALDGINCAAKIS